MNKTLETLDVGDVVAIESRHGISRRVIDHATRTTLVVGSIKYRRKDGRRITSDTWNPETMSPWDESKSAQYASQQKREAASRARRRLADWNTWENVPDDKVMEAVARLAEIGIGVAEKSSDRA